MSRLIVVLVALSLTSCGHAPSLDNPARVSSSRGFAPRDSLGVACGEGPDGLGLCHCWEDSDCYYVDCPGLTCEGGEYPDALGKCVTAPKAAPLVAVADWCGYDCANDSQCVGSSGCEFCVDHECSALSTP